MTHTRIWIPLVITGLMAAPATVIAQSATQPEVRGYLGGGLGYYRLNDEDFPDEEDDIKDNRWSWRVFAGMEANRIFSLEAGYVDLGTAEDGNLDTDINGWTIAGMAALPVTEFFAPYARVGQFFWDRERSTSGPVDASYSDDGNDMFYGVGARFTLTERTDLRLEYDRMSVDDTDVDLASINMQFRF
ncbi:porin family protein [Aquisalimonas asiatica]|uniref:Outer membrane protein beta-barrel domain-containing protein n=1 Tax=Aquisalimonas asiatica TaxID=406100 RepID=A0A1H8QXV8_9GAMM|nr:porin family protein [Aquisalimonas asiatica]SEO58837.1 Outer membrane protein beta-barrel domain-containing protein [Aquisalimonas asiatica]